MNCFLWSNNISINIIKFLHSLYFVVHSHFRVSKKKIRILGSLCFNNSHHSMLSFNDLWILIFFFYSNSCFLKNFSCSVVFFGYSVNKQFCPTPLFSWAGWYFLVCMLIPLNWLCMKFHRLWLCVMVK